ncbi:MAG: PP2C family serine/threonine-protein phosphatase [Blastocatellia bacterium]
MTTASATHLTFCAETNVGRVRQGNEDNFLILDLTSATSWAGIATEMTGLQTLPLGAQGVVFAVSDGMGGALAGEVASRMAVEIVRDWMPKFSAAEEYRHLSLQERLRVAIEQANAAIHIENLVNPERRGMGATFTAVAIADEHACFAQVGDSRAHLIRQGQITRVTKDQSVVQQLIDLGQITEEQAATHPRRNYILQALGATHEIDVVVSYLPLRAGDLLLLCSDGLSGKMTADEMLQVVTAAADFQAACTQLIALANERGGEDNITVMLVQVTGEKLVTPDDEPITPEFIARPATSPTAYLLDDVGLPPPEPEDDAEDFADPAPPAAVAFSPAAASTVQPTTSSLSTDTSFSESSRAAAPAPRGIDGRKIALFFVLVALFLSGGAVYLNYRFTADRGALQQRLQSENRQLLEGLRTRIATLRTRANGDAAMNAKLDVLSDRLNQAAALPATQYQQVGQACSEVETAIYLMEQNPGK